MKTYHSTPFSIKRVKICKEARDGIMQQERTKLLKITSKTRISTFKACYHNS